MNGMSDLEYGAKNDFKIGLTAKRPRLKRQLSIYVLLVYFRQTVSFIPKWSRISYILSRTSVIFEDKQQKTPLMFDYTALDSLKTIDTFANIIRLILTNI